MLAGHGEDVDRRKTSGCRVGQALLESGVGAEQGRLGLVVEARGQAEVFKAHKSLHLWCVQVHIEVV